MRTVLDMLDGRADTQVRAVSSLYRTPPWGRIDQPDFLNAAAHIATDLAPRPLLAACLDIEHVLKRVRKERWGPRVIDIDILIYDDLSLDEEGLVIPHPRMRERAFVLVPLAEIAASRTVDGVTVAELERRIDRSGLQRLAPAARWWRPPPSGPGAPRRHPNSAHGAKEGI